MQNLTSKHSKDKSGCVFCANCGILIGMKREALITNVEMCNLCEPFTQLIEGAQHQMAEALAIQRDAKKSIDNALNNLAQRKKTEDRFREIERGRN